MNERQTHEIIIMGLMKIIKETPLEKSKKYRIKLYKELKLYKTKYHEPFPVDEFYGNKR